MDAVVLAVGLIESKQARELKARIRDGG